MVIKRIFAIIALVLATATLQRVTASDFDYEGLTYVIDPADGNTVSLTGGTVTNGQLIIPATVEYEGINYIVNAISWWAFPWRTEIRSVVMPDCITSIGDFAFSNCTSLETVTWSKGLKSISQFAFSDCSALKSAILPEGVKSIGADGFAKCASMTEVSLPQSLTSIGEAAFNGCHSLTSIDIPGGVTTISRLMISGEKITHIGLPEGLKNIHEMGIHGCTALKEIRLPRSIVSMRANAISMSVESNVYASWPRPFRIGNDAFDYDAIVHVPVNTASYYHQDGTWPYMIVEDASLGTYYSYAVSDAENGTVILRQDGKDITEDYFSNFCPLEILLKPDEGYELKYLSVNGHDVTASVSEDIYTINTPDSNITVEAVFGLPRYVWLTIRQGIGGESCIKVERIKDVELAIIPDEGWLIHSVTLNGVDISGQLETAANLLTLPPLEGASVLNVVFEKDESGIQEVERAGKMHVSAYDNTLHITNLDPDASVEVYTTDGQSVAHVNVTDGEVTLTDIPNGIYIVTDGTTTVKVAL